MLGLPHSVEELSAERSVAFEGTHDPRQPTRQRGIPIHSEVPEEGRRIPLVPNKWCIIQETAAAEPELAQSEKGQDQGDASCPRRVKQNRNLCSHILELHVSIAEQEQQLNDPDERQSDGKKGHRPDDLAVPLEARQAPSKRQISAVLEAVREEVGFAGIVVEELLQHIEGEEQHAHVEAPLREQPEPVRSRQCAPGDFRQLQRAAKGVIHARHVSWPQVSLLVVPVQGACGEVRLCQGDMDIDVHYDLVERDRRQSYRPTFHEQEVQQRSVPDHAPRQDVQQRTDQIDANGSARRAEVSQQRFRHKSYSGQGEQRDN
mmetsp:Transcript_5721/g.21705  ORF Transcript_5721/g.21705 Transcript_5721/m.21705 type:complete len:318 (+) Transcript_5721:534-1487(+)